MKYAVRIITETPKGYNVDKEDFLTSSIVDARKNAIRKIGTNPRKRAIINDVENHTNKEDISYWNIEAYNMRGWFTTDLNKYADMERLMKPQRYTEVDPVTGRLKKRYIEL